MMSLKAFHILFVTLSVILSFGVAVWAGRSWMGVASGLTGVFLVVYGIWFYRKISRLKL